MGKSICRRYAPSDSTMRRRRHSEGQLTEFKVLTDSDTSSAAADAYGTRGRRLQPARMALQPQHVSSIRHVAVPTGAGGTIPGVFRLKPVSFGVVLHFTFGMCKTHRLYLHFRSSRGLESLNGRKFHNETPSSPTA